MKWVAILSFLLLLQGSDEGISFDHPFDHVISQSDEANQGGHPLDSAFAKNQGRRQLEWIAGVEDDPDGLLLGGVKEVVSWGDSLFFVLDDVSRMVHVLDQAGRVQDAFGGRGRGPGEFSEPVAMAVSNEGHLYVADRDHRVQRFLRKPAGYAFDSSFILHFTPTAVCAIGEHVVLAGLDGNLHTVHVYTTDGAHERSFGHHFSSDNPIKSLTFSEVSSIVCGEELETIVVSYHYVPFVLAYSVDGRSLWKSTLEVFRPIATRAGRSSDGRPEFRLLRPEEGTHIGTTLSLVTPDVALLQVRRVDRARSKGRYETYTLDLSTGAGFFTGFMSSRVESMTESHTMHYDVSPFPRLRAYTH